MSTRYALAEYLEGIRYQVSNYPNENLARDAMERLSRLGIETELWAIDEERNALMLATRKGYAHETREERVTTCA